MKYLQGIEHLHTLFNATTVAFDCETTGLQPVYGGYVYYSWPHWIE